MVLNVKFVIKQDAYPDELQKGEAIVYNRLNKTKGLMLACPECGHVATGTHTYDNETMTLKPSIKCGKCNFHGHLTNGEFTKSKT